ncbi:MAG: ATP-dependent DNA helicase RecG [Lachnospiraceae bacterium]|nr:ATP-dependent DNA helicase RecG [Lachnospiraceae bacterium]
MADRESIQSIKGIGEKTGKLFEKLGIRTIDELIRYYPRTYVRYAEPVKLKEASGSSPVAVRVFLPEDFTFRQARGKSIGTGYVSDGENTASVVFFNTPYYRKRLVRGASYIFYGTVQKENSRFRMEQPLFYTEAEYAALRSSLQPVYSLTKGLSNRTVQKAVLTCIEEEAAPELFEEYLPGEILREFGLCSLREAARGIHYPESFENLKTARERLVFDELLQFLYMLRRLRAGNERPRSEFGMIETAYPKRFAQMLPYRLTGAQERAFREIVEDLTGGFVMNRLIQGDVGSGKTIVSFLALLLCVDNGFQGALMAPTEILASQHFENMMKLTETYGLPFRPVLLTGSLTAKARREVYERIESGDANVVIGTHALIQEKVNYRNLALVVTDEQHRFGVRQREALAKKGAEPHILVMSATPIPRTLAIVIYGDLDISVMDEKPAERLPIKNCVVGPSYRETAYRFLASEIDKKHQVYVICPLVEKSEDLTGVADVVSYAAHLKTKLPPTVRIDILHGRMKPDLKQTVMERFLGGDIDILVSTTVVEVGVDVPNATVMMIENAERFGLSALHQLRGRIGRGASQSYCIFLNGDERNEENKRLEILNHSNDGFEIAKEDLKLRGAGDLFGIRQSGDMPFVLADVYEDSKLILKISAMLDRIFPEREKEPSGEYKHLFDFLDGNTNKYIDFRTI